MTTCFVASILRLQNSSQSFFASSSYLLKYLPYLSGHHHSILLSLNISLIRIRAGTGRLSWMWTTPPWQGTSSSRCLMMTWAKMTSWEWWPFLQPTFSVGRKWRGPQVYIHNGKIGLFSSFLCRAWFPLDQAKSGEVCVSMEFRMTPAARAETRKTSSASSGSSNNVSGTKKSSSASLYHRFINQNRNTMMIF